LLEEENAIEKYAAIQEEEMEDLSEKDVIKLVN